MSVAVPVIDSWDGTNRRIYLKLGVSDIYPIEDIYHEYTNARRLDITGLRKYAPLLRAEGNVKKGGGAFTPRYVVLIDGTKIVPYNETLQINQLGDMITDDPDVDSTLYDISSLTVPKVIFIKPSEAEIIQLNSKAIEYASFNGAVHIDILNGIAGTEYNIGTPSNPVDNISDAVIIANISGNGFEELHIHGNLVLGTGHNVNGFKIVGQNPNKTEITIESAALVDGCFFMESSISGVFDGDAMLERCVINNIDYVQGRIYLCTLKGVITLFGDLRIYNCYDGHSGSSLIPIIDMNGSGKNLIVSNWRGQLKITNLTGANYVEIILDGGDIILDTATVINGFIQISGIGHLKDELGNELLTGSWNGVEITNDLIGTQTVAHAVWNAIDGEIICKMLYNKVIKSGDIITIYEDDGSTIWKTFDLANGGRVEL